MWEPTEKVPAPLEAGAEPVRPAPDPSVTMPAPASPLRRSHVPACLIILLLAGAVAGWVFRAALIRPYIAATLTSDVKSFTNTLGMKFVRIEPGTFTMGSPEGEAGHREDETPHQVTLTRPWYMGVHHVTRGQFAAFIADSGYKTDAEQAASESKWKRNTWFEQKDNHPVVYVSWNDAVAFAEWLCKREGLRYRLPTEAEWEYACRATTTTPFNTGATISTGQANYNGDLTYGAGVKGEYRKKTTAVGTFAPNKWGLYDMHGNTWQWCSDVYNEKYYDNGAATDPAGPEQHPDAPHVLRGGSWDDDPVHCRSASRDGFAPGYRFSNIGFRLVLDNR